KRGVFLAVALALANLLSATELTTLHSFLAPPAFPYAALVSDHAGFLYGTAATGGSYGLGVIYRVRIDGTGFEVMHSFTPSPSDGPRPGFCAALVLAGPGILMGTTESGGTRGGGGTVFSIRTDGSGFSIIHSFQAGASEGWSPESGLAVDSAGNLFG